MTLERLTDLTAAEAAERIRQGSLAPEALTEAYLARIAYLNPTLNALLTVLEQPAMREARYAADALRRGELWGPLHGVPIAVKDLIDVAGAPTTAGSDFLRDNVAAEDSVVVRRLRAAGATIIGKAHLHEFAIGATNVNPHYGPARNPWNPEMSPGGSSGGSAAAVAGGMCAAALGTDTGGSVRVPAAFCGLTGIRPARGQVSAPDAPIPGVVTMSWTLDTVGPIARDARDTALLLDALDRRQTTEHSDRLGVPVRGLRLGVPTDDFFWQATELTIVAAVHAAIDVLSTLGVTAVDVSLPLAPEALRASGVISLGDAAAYHRLRLAAEPERFGADVRARLERGAAGSAPDYASARQLGRRWRDSLLELLEDEALDGFVLPTTPVAGHEIDQSDALAAAGDLLRFTYPFSLSGLAAISLPCGFTPDGLPVGLQIVTPGAATALRLAHAYQQHTDWHTRRPPV